MTNGWPSFYGEEDVPLSLWKKKILLQKYIQNNIICKTWKVYITKTKTQRPKNCDFYRNIVMTQYR